MIIQSRNLSRILPVLLVFSILSSLLFAGGSSEAESELFSIGVFIPGQVEGSPTYELLVEGVGLAAQNAMDAGREVEVKILEAGFNQAEWGEKLLGLTATGSYDLIISSNPAIPDLLRSISEQFPSQRFIVMDGENPGLPNLAAVMLNQFEQAYLSGYFAGLVTQNRDLEGANEELVAGFLAGQEYPVMNNEIRPGFIAGLQAAAGPEAQVEFRVLGNWFDAEKARELAESMFRQGADVILTIAGSGNQGVIAAAESQSRYVLWYDSPGYFYSPGTVIGSSTVNIASLTTEVVSAALEGSLEYGTTRFAGIAQGAVGYATDESEYVEFVPESIRIEMERILTAIKNGDLEPRRGE